MTPPNPTPVPLPGPARSDIDLLYLSWPFFEAGHAALAAKVDAWAGATLPGLIDTPATPEAVDACCRRLAQALGDGGWLDLAVPADGRFDVRALCLLRETLGRHAALADFTFAMQGLGSAPITLFGTSDQRARWLPAVRAGRSLAAFALSEPEAGSDAGALATTARPVPGGYRLDGVKTWISNGGIAGHYVLFARVPPHAEGPGGVTAFIVPGDAPGLEVSARLEVIAPHPLATLSLRDCLVPASHRLGEEGRGFKIAMTTLDIFRPTVGAAALGFARRALAAALGRCRDRRLFGGTLGDLQMSQARLADMALDIDTSALLVYRAAWAKDRPDLSGVARVTREAAMAKLHATESAQRVIDGAVQLFGALGVLAGHPVEELYREVRALRIYEGASEVQKIIIARQLLDQAGSRDAGGGAGGAA